MCRRDRLVDDPEQLDVDALRVAARSALYPGYSGIVTAVFSMKLSSGSTVHIGLTGAKSPALVVTPLDPNQCVRGWLAFATPKGAHATELIYTFGKPIVWKL